jgi:hypothetical protein
MFSQELLQSKIHDKWATYFHTRKIMTCDEPSFKDVGATNTSRKDIHRWRRKVAIRHSSANSSAVSADNKIKRNKPLPLIIKPEKI